MQKAFVDTTVLANALLKSGEVGDAARTALRRYRVSDLPVYAIKEFQQGPLRNILWLHNKFKQQRSFAKAVRSLSRMALSPKRYTTATALEALAEAAERFGRRHPQELVAKYGEFARNDVVLGDEYRLHLRRLIYRAWRNRRKVTTHVTNPLQCYPETAPAPDPSGMLIMAPLHCRPDPECCLAAALRSQPKQISRLREIADAQPDRSENRRRSKALKAIAQKAPVT